MNKLVYKIEDRVAIVTPSPRWEGTLEELAQKDIPVGCEYFVVEDQDIPDYKHRDCFDLVNGVLVVCERKLKTKKLKEIRFYRDETWDAFDHLWMLDARYNNSEKQADLRLLARALQEAPQAAETLLSTMVDLEEITGLKLRDCVNIPESLAEDFSVA